MERFLASIILLLQSFASPLEHILFQPRFSTFTRWLLTPYFFASFRISNKMMERLSVRISCQKVDFNINLTIFILFKLKLYNK